METIGEYKNLKQNKFHMRKNTESQPQEKEEKEIKKEEEKEIKNVIKNKKN
jgi:hypothetical protein